MTKEVPQSAAVRFVPLVHAADEETKARARAERRRQRKAKKQLVIRGEEGSQSKQLERLPKLAASAVSACGRAMGVGSGVDWDARYSKGWAYGKQPNSFLVEAATSFLPTAMAADPTCAHAADTKPASDVLPVDGADGSPCGGSGGRLRVLSLAEGQGRNVVYLASLGHCCTAVDSSAVAAQKAQLLAAQRGLERSIRTIVADVTTLDPSLLGKELEDELLPVHGLRPCQEQEQGSVESTADDVLEESTHSQSLCRSPSGQWDVIVSIFCALEPTARRKLHRACAASLRPGGIMIIECFAPAHASTHSNQNEATMRDKHVQEGSASPLPQHPRHRAPPQPRAWGGRSGPSDPELLVSTEMLKEDFLCSAQDDVPNPVATEQMGEPCCSSFGSDMEILLSREVRRQLNEGKFHRGFAELSQFVVRKKGPTYRVYGGNNTFRGSECVPAEVKYCTNMDKVFASAATAVQEHGSSQAMALSTASACASASASAAAAMNEVQGLAAATADSAVTAADDASSSRLARTSKGKKARFDHLLFCAPASVAIACAFAEDSNRCRYCWVPQHLCLCERFRSLVKHDFMVGNKLGVVGPTSNASVDTVTAPLLCGRQLRWVILIHPNEFLRATASARLAPFVLGGSATPNASTFYGGKKCTSVGAVGGDECELLVFGAAGHLARLDKILRQDAKHTRILFPGPIAECDSVRDLFTPPESIKIRNPGSSAPKLPQTRADVPEPPLTVIVPDGSWQHAGAMVRYMQHRYGELHSEIEHDENSGIGGVGDACSRASQRKSNQAGVTPLCFVRLSDELVGGFFSPLIESLRKGAGRGRISTLEACGIFLAEAEATFAASPSTVQNDVAHGNARNGASMEARQPLGGRIFSRFGVLSQRVHAGLVPLTEHVSTHLRISDPRAWISLPNERTKSSVRTQKPPPNFGTVVAAMEMAAKEESAASLFPAGLRRCVVCGAVLASPLQMKGHVLGRRHCEMVAHLYVTENTQKFENGCESRPKFTQSRPVVTPPNASEAKAGFIQFSSVPLGLCVPEPPDVALVALNKALESVL